MTFQVRYYLNKKNFEVLGTYENKILAYGMRKKFSQNNNWKKELIKVIPIN